jgi:hypothetical protein
MAEKRPLSDAEVAELARELAAIAQHLSSLTREADTSTIGTELAEIRAHLKLLAQANSDVRKSLGHEPND